jgi:hypothetical protein
MRAGYQRRSDFEASTTDPDAALERVMHSEPPGQRSGRA